LPQERAREKDVGSVGFEREDGARYGNACGDAPRWRYKKRGPDVFIIFSERNVDKLFYSVRSLDICSFVHQKIQFATNLSKNY
jgi:hypothetical protein